MNNRRIKKFPVFSTVGVVNNTELTTARYWTLVEKTNESPSYCRNVFIRICLVLIVSPSVVRSPKFSPSFKISDEINVRITHLCCSCYVTSPWLCSWYYQVYQLQLVVSCCNSSFNIKMLGILPAQCIYTILWIIEQRANISLHHQLIRVYNQNGMCICSVRTTYLTVIQLFIRVGRVKFMMSCSGRFL